jgi:hypothetical protein
MDIHIKYTYTCGTNHYWGLQMELSYTSDIINEFSSVPPKHTLNRLSTLPQFLLMLRLTWLTIRIYKSPKRTLSVISSLTSTHHVMRWITSWLYVLLSDSHILISSYLSIFKHCIHAITGHLNNNIQRYHGETSVVTTFDY